MSASGGQVIAAYAEGPGRRLPFWSHSVASHVAHADLAEEFDEASAGIGGRLTGGIGDGDEAPGEAEGAVAPSGYWSSSTVWLSSTRRWGWCKLVKASSTPK